MNEFPTKHKDTNSKIRNDEEVFKDEECAERETQANE